jgi:DNA/RNA-binding domain of Phe-tRNA-synthetase-like protein
MGEPILKISDSVADKIPGLVIIAGVLEVEAPQTERVSRYLAYSCALRVCEQPESFTPLGGGPQEETVLGDIVYADDAEILTRHFLWRQAEKGKITGASKRCVVICELLAAMGEETLQSSKSLIEDKFCSVLGGTLSGVAVLRC